MLNPIASATKASSQWIPTPGKAARMVLCYAALSSAWIVCSGWLLHHFVRDEHWEALLENLKGWLFVVITSLLLGWILNRYFHEIRRSAQQLQNNETRLRLLGDNLPDCYVFEYVPRPNGNPRFTYISAGVERVHGVKPADVLRDANGLPGLGLPERLPPLAAAEALSVQNLADFEMEVWTRHLDGKNRLVHLRSRPHRSDDGTILWEGIAIDITERKRAESALREREEQLRLFVQHSPAAIAMLDCNMCYLVVSRRWLCDYRLHGENLTGRSHYEVFPEIPERWKEIHQRCLAGAVEKSDADPFLRADGSTDWVRWEIRPWRTDQGAVGGLIIFSEVITERKQAEAALRESEKKYRSLFECSRDAIVTGDPVSGQFTSGNPAALKMFGAETEKEFISYSPGDLSPERQPDGRLSVERAKEISEMVIREGSLFFEWTHKRISGEEFITNVLLTRIEQDGKPMIMSTIRDITRSKKVEAALRQSEKQFRTMFELASIGMAQADPSTGQWLRVNQKMCEITGYSPTEMLHLRVPEITHPDDRVEDWAAFQRVVRGDVQDYRMEKRYVRKDGKVAWVNVNVTLIRNAAGEPLRTVATIEDITARKQAEDERMRLVTAMEQSAESIVITDIDGAILYVNPAFEQISGYTRQEVIGRNPRFLKSGKQDAVFYQHLWETLRHGEVWHGRLVNKRKNGVLYEEEATISPVRDAAGRVVNYVAIKLDVTREVELEEQLRQVQKMEAIGQLAGGVAHDFNNILAAMMMQVDLTVMAGNLPEAAQEGLQQLRASTERAASLTRQLLLFSRKQVMQLRDLDLNEAVTGLAKMLQRIIGEDVRLQLHLHPAPLILHADAGMLDQVLMNLAINARDAMPDGGRLLIETAEKTVDAAGAQLQAEATPGHYAWLSVTDTGNGIPPEVLPRVFEPFFTTKGPGKGTGLGLATVFGIVKQHQGWIRVSSEPGQGANFQLFLPLSKTIVTAGKTMTGPKPRGGTETILLVEDDTALRKMTRMTLETRGYKVYEAANGLEALETWKRHRGTVILLLTDLVMPGGVTGQQLARRLQADKSNLKVIFTSGYSAEIAGREIHLQDGERFMQKPFQPDQLLDAVRRSLDDLPD